MYGAASIIKMIHLWSVAFVAILGFSEPNETRIPDKIVLERYREYGLIE